MKKIKVKSKKDFNNKNNEKDHKRIALVIFFFNWVWYKLNYYFFCFYIRIMFNKFKFNNLIKK